jgi:hypothetical protein
MKTTSQNQTYDDPIVAEIRQIRADLAREANYDLHTICERAREAERKHPERLARPPAAPRPKTSDG